MYFEVILVTAGLKSHVESKYQNKLRGDVHRAVLCPTCWNVMLDGYCKF